MQLAGERERVRRSLRRIVEIAVASTIWASRSRLELTRLRGRVPVSSRPRSAGERDRSHALVLDEHVANLGGRATGRSASREGRLPSSSASRSARRSLRRRFQHDRAAGGERRRDLVGDEIEREVEKARSRRPRRSAGAA
jgi:hypothetical protein